MDFLKDYKNKIFFENIKNFNELALELFKFQAETNKIYKRYIQYLCLNPADIKRIEDIPFLPVQFFKEHKILCEGVDYQTIFESSGTSNLNPSKHFISDVEIYKKSLHKSFELFFGNINDYIILALLPSYLESKNSSLIFMVKELIKASNDNRSGFYLYNYKDLYSLINSLSKGKKKIFLLGVSFALLEFAQKYNVDMHNSVVMETGGMKGRGKELPREELHKILCKSFNKKEIQSEYGMTELLSQSYSMGKGIFKSPPWKKILIRNIYDPFEMLEANKSGGINVIDLANITSCAFIETSDIGVLQENNTFKVLGRIDNSDIRGCNLMLK